jgi:hypothetical protein
MSENIDYSKIVEIICRLSYTQKMRLLSDINRLIEAERERTERESPGEKNEGPSWLGCMSEVTEIKGNITAPVLEENEWEALAL